MTDNEMKIVEIKQRIALLCSYLSNTDYQAIKYAEGELTLEEYSYMKEQRKQWRSEINELKIQLELLQ